MYALLHQWSLYEFIAHSESKRILDSKSSDTEVRIFESNKKSL